MNYATVQSHGTIHCNRNLASFKVTVVSEENKSTFSDLLVCYQAAQDQDPVRTFFLIHLIPVPTVP